MKVNLYLKNNACLTVTVQQTTMDSFHEALVMANVIGSTHANGTWRFGDFIVIDDTYIKYDDIVYFKEAE
ncbi:TruB domain-containing protein [Bacillus phage vB_BcgM]|nr:TruB domain-containing protein [Bacillus phage vB_BcgM]